MADSSKQADGSGIATSFADRLTFPSKTEEAGKKFDWAEDASTPMEEQTQPDATQPTPAQSTAKEPASVGAAQIDGAPELANGSELTEPEFDVNVKLADLQDDPNNPLFSAKTFEELNLRDELTRGLAMMHFRKPSKIQERALPLLLKNPPTNLIGQSQSGTGKTAAFVLNMLSRIDLSTDAPQCLVLAPTRELAKQIAGVAAVMGVFLEDKGLKIAEAIPNPATRGQQIKGQIVVGTPGTTMDMIRRRQLAAKDIKVLTLDEADNMLDLQGMGDQCKRVKQLLPPNLQVVLFSATFEQQVLDFANVFAPNSNVITLEREKLTVKGIAQMYMDCSSDEDKYKALLRFYGIMTIASTIIFVKRRVTASEIAKRMTAEGHAVVSLTGELEGTDRDAVFQKFRTGEAKVLITTNVLSRGIDVNTVTLVINYDVPDLPGGRPDYETYLHRIGRTGRFGRTGAALTFVHDRDSWEKIMDICQHFGVQPIALKPDDWDATEKTLKNVMRNARNTSINQDAAMEG